jgi:hypothetical protein
MTIKLTDIWSISDLDEYKVHFARFNQHSQPLDVFVRDSMEWQTWQEYRPVRNDFNRPFIFSLAQFYHEPNTWLFGGVYEVLARHEDRYEVRLTEQGKGFVGRLKLKSDYRLRQTRVNLENHYADFEVQEILREPYTGRSFPGFEDIELPFGELETLVRNSRPDWQATLASAKGVYLISDTLTGKRYVGSAYGPGGIWSRWCEYVATGHGHNVELKSLISDPTLAYCREAFQFALLEHRPMSTPDEEIIHRESFWKRILLTRGEFGLNRN